MNQRQFERHSESCLSDVEGQISLFDSFNEAEYLQQNDPEEPEISEVIVPSYRRSKAKGKREAYDRITQMMHIDNGFDNLSVADRKKQRQFVLAEKVDAYFAWVKLKYTQVTHNSTIGKALAYSIHQEDYLRVFLSDGNIPMDNNYAEQAIRPFTVGRKNFFLIESSRGANASAILYSLVETAKANTLNTCEYFNLLLTEIPTHMDDKNLRFLDDLLPWSTRMQKECPSRYRKS